MLIFHDLLPIFERANDMVAATAEKFMEYNQETKCFEAYKPHRSQTLTSLQLAFYRVINLGVFLRILKLLNLKSSSVSMEVNFLIIILGMVANVTERYRIRSKNPDAFVTFMNDLSSLERQSTKGFSKNISNIWEDIEIPMASRKVKIVKLFLRVTHKAMSIAPFVVAFASAVIPDQPTNAIKIICASYSTKNDTNLALEISKRIFLFFGNYLFWRVIASQGLCIVNEMLVGPLSLQFSNCTIESRFGALARISNYWDWDVSQELTEIVNAYRSLQIIVESCNRNLRTLLFMTIFNIGLVEICSAVNLIVILASKAEVPLPIQLFLGTVVIEATGVTIVIYGFAGDLNEVSAKSAIKNKAISRDFAWKHRGYIRRYFRSLSPLKICFGLSNFIERKTTLVFQSFCVDRIIDLLLVWK